MMVKTQGIRKLLVLALLSAGYVGAAQAGTPTNPVTATANATFTSPSAVTLQITPTPDLAAGAYVNGSVIASAEADATESSVIAFRWTPGSGDITPSGPKNIENWITINGTNDPADDSISLTVKSLAGVVVTDGGDGWIVPAKALTNLPLEVDTNKDQTVNADTYVLSLDAAEWTS